MIYSFSVEFDNFQTRFLRPLSYYQISTAFQPRRKNGYWPHASSSTIIVRSRWIQCHKWWWWYVHFRWRLVLFRRRGIDQRTKDERWRRGTAWHPFGLVWDEIRLQDASRDWRCWGFAENVCITLPHPISCKLGRWDQEVPSTIHPAMTTVPYTKPRTKADVVRISRSPRH